MYTVYMYTYVYLFKVEFLTLWLPNTSTGCSETWQIATEGRRGVSVHILGLGARRALSQPLYSWEEDPPTSVQEAGWISEPVWMGPENLAPTGVRTQLVICRNTDYAILTH